MTTKAKKPRTRRLQVDVRPETIDELKAWADDELLTMAAIVRRVLEDAITDRNNNNNNNNMKGGV
jgi:hypothetical protein